MNNSKEHYIDTYVLFDFNENELENAYEKI